MTWSDFYVICFLVGFGLSALALLAGSVHLHLPHLNVHHGIHMPHAHVHVHAGHGAGHGADLPWFNFGTIAAFLAWFGGTGYLLEHYYGVWFVAALGVATLSGIGAAAVVFWFLARVLMSREEALDPADYDMVGVLGRMSIPIRPGGTGELIYSQGGTRRVTGARSEDGTAIPKGAEVMVSRYEKGIAYVRPWEDPAGELEPKS
jgi:membrane protein implicated in regulation of membrane protease activity